MTLSCIELMVKVRRARELIDAWPRESVERAYSSLAAEMLHSLWPGAALYACLLPEKGEALDKAGRARPEWLAPIRDELARRTHGVGVDRPASAFLDLAAASLVWEEIRCDDQLYGWLGMAVSATGIASAGLFLAFCAQSLALRLEVEAQELLKEESADDGRLADVGEASIPVAHEFNNFLNGLLLHTAVLKLQLPEEALPGLEEVRRQAMGAAALIQQFQYYRRREERSFHPVDLNRAVWGAFKTLDVSRDETSLPPTSVGTEASCPLRFVLPYGKTNGSASAAVFIRLDMAVEELPVVGAAGDLKRLCVFLLRNAAGIVAAQGGEVGLRTARVGEKIVLQVEDVGPPVPVEQLSHLFEPSALGRDGTSPLELAACKTLARRLLGTIRAENRPGGGTVLVVEWEAAKEEVRMRNIG